MKSRNIIFILCTIVMLFRLGRCIMSTQPNEQTIMNERNLEKYGSYKARYAAWEQKYGKSYLESLSEEDRAVFLKDVNCLTKTTDDISRYSSTSVWDSIKNDYLSISYPKNWEAKFDQNSMVYTFKPQNQIVNKNKEHIFYAELIGINSLKHLMSETHIEKEKFFPEFANKWWQQNAIDGYNIRGINKIKFIGYDTYHASGQIVRGESRLSTTMYLMNSPQGIYQFTIIGDTESMIQYAKIAANIFQTLNLRKEI